MAPQAQNSVVSSAMTLGPGLMAFTAQNDTICLCFCEEGFFLFYV